jgi:hypothetical protein
MVLGVVEEGARPPNASLGIQVRSRGEASGMEELVEAARN